MDNLIDFSRRTGEEKVDQSIENLVDQLNSTIRNLQTRLDEVEESIPTLPTTPSYAMIALEGNQTTNLLVGNHIQFNSLAGRPRTDIVLSSGGGQSDGLITLAPGKTYLIMCWIGGWTNEGSLEYRWIDHDTGNPILGDTGRFPLLIRLFDNIAHDINNMFSDAFTITPTEELVIKLDCTDSSTPQGVLQGTRVWITEIL